MKENLLRLKSPTSGQFAGWKKLSVKKLRPWVLAAVLALPAITQAAPGLNYHKAKVLAGWDGAAVPGPDNHAQAPIANAQPMSASATDSWILDTTVGNVECYHKIVLCGERNAVFLKFINRNNYEVNVAWKESFVTKQVPQETEGFFGEKQLVLKSGETSQQDCSSTQNPKCLVVFHQVNPTYLADILGFRFKNIRVSAAQ